MIIWALIVTLTLKSAYQSFRRTHRFVMMHYHTKFGDKRFSGSEDIVRTNIHWHFEPSLWPWARTQQSIFFQKTLRLMMMYRQTKFGRKRTSSSEDIVESYFDNVNPHSVLDLYIANFFFPSAWQSGSWQYTTIPSLVTKIWAVQNTSLGQIADTRTDGPIHSP